MFHLLKILWLNWSIWYYKAARDALTRYQPLHPDLPGVVLKINQLEYERATL